MSLKGNWPDDSDTVFIEWYDYKRKTIENQFPKIINVSIQEYIKWSNNKKSYYKIRRSGFNISKDNFSLFNRYL